MESISFECKIITPMFLTGADGRTPELREPSVKGAMRFWWRAINGNLDLKEMKSKEDEIFGSGGDNAKKSSFSIFIEKSQVNTDRCSPLPHHEDNKFKLNCFKEQEKFKIVFYINDEKRTNEKFIKNLFLLLSYLGGLGRRSRRGFGSFKVEKINEEVVDNQSTNLTKIFETLKQISPNYKYNEKGEDSVIEVKERSKFEYPWIEKIEIGKKDSLDILLINIGKASHNNASISLGSGKPRFASPIYVSILNPGDKFQIVITTLHSVLPNGKKIERQKQENFKNELKKEDDNNG